MAYLEALVRLTNSFAIKAGGLFNQAKSKSKLGENRDVEKTMTNFTNTALYVFNPAISELLG